MSLAELLSDSKGLSNFSGNASTCIRNYSIKQDAGATGATMDGGVLNRGVFLFDPRATEVTSGSHPNLLNASATGSVMGAEVVSKVSLILNDNRSSAVLAAPPRDNGKVGLYEASVKVAGSLGAVEWGKSLSLFGSSAKACDVTPGAGFTAAEPAMQFKFSLPELTPGLKVDLALAGLAKDNVSPNLTDNRLITGASTQAITTARGAGLEGKVSYDTGYGAKLNLEFLNNKAHGITPAAAQGAAASNITDLPTGVARKMKGLAGSIDVDMSGFTGCLGTAKTTGLGHIHPAVGGFMDATATQGAAKFKHTYAKGGYALDSSVVSVPLNFEVNYGKTKHDGCKGTTFAPAGQFAKNTRTGICIGTPLSEDLTFDFCYDRYKTKNSAGLTNKMNVTSLCGLYKF